MCLQPASRIRPDILHCTKMSSLFFALQYGSSVRHLTVFASGLTYYSGRAASAAEPSAAWF
jgi:hypothetical protein